MTHGFLGRCIIEISTECAENFVKNMSQNTMASHRISNGIGPILAFPATAYFSCGKLNVECQAVFGMSDVDHFLASVSGVGLKNWTMSGVGKNPFLGPNNASGNSVRFSTSFLLYR